MNKDKFQFDFEIIDWDKVTSQLSPIDIEQIFAELAKSDEKLLREETSENE